MDDALKSSAEAFLLELEDAVAAEVSTRNMPRAFFPVLMPCNVLCVVTQTHFHVIFTSEDAGGLPRQIWLDRRDRTSSHAPEEESLMRYAVYEFGFKSPQAFNTPSSALSLSGDQREDLVRAEAADYVEVRIAELTTPRCFPGYEALQPMLDAFSGDHPRFERNVFIAMRFRGTEQFVEIDRALRESFAKYGLTGLRADDKMYAVDGDLWNNVCVYMMGCKYAVCVFEEIDEREFNPNVGIEYGFLRAMNRQVLLLKEQRVPTMPTDMIGKMYRSFDSYKITHSLLQQLGLWAERDLGLKAIS
jgi:hypothetical protein